jgi:TPR repeat protein
MVARVGRLVALASRIAALTACAGACAGPAPVFPGPEAVGASAWPVRPSEPNPCGSLSGAGCRTLASLFQKGKELPLNPLRAVVLFEGACERGDLAACVEAADLYTNHAHRRYTNGALLGCSGQDGVDCILGSSESDVRASMAYYQRACDRGIARTCTDLGLLFLDEHGTIARDVARAQGLLVRACERGDGPGCRELASFLRERDPTRALSAADRGCEFGDREACIFAAESYEEGEGTNADLGRALDRYARGCASPALYGCTRYADLLLASRGARDHAAAAAIYAGDCRCNGKEDGGSSCRKLGDLYEHGDGVPRDVWRAASLYGDGCRCHDEQACRARRRLGGSPLL